MAGRSSVHAVHCSSKSVGTGMFQGRLRFHVSCRMILAWMTAGEKRPKYIKHCRCAVGDGTFGNLG